MKRVRYSRLHKLGMLLIATGLFMIVFAGIAGLMYENRVVCSDDAIID